MKIHIIGGSGSGKTYYATKLSAETGIKHYDLDDIQWNNESNAYGQMNTKEKRKELLDAILSKNDWIIEGVYYKWCTQCFEEADKIYFLRTDVNVCKKRVMFRFIKRKLQIEKGKKETIKSLRDLLKRMEKYQLNDVPKIQKILEKYKDKVIEI